MVEASSSPLPSAIGPNRLLLDSTVADGQRPDGQRIDGQRIDDQRFEGQRQGDGPGVRPYIDEHERLSTIDSGVGYSFEDGSSTGGGGSGGGDGGGDSAAVEAARGLGDLREGAGAEAFERGGSTDGAGGGGEVGGGDAGGDAGGGTLELQRRLRESKTMATRLSVEVSELKEANGSLEAELTELRDDHHNYEGKGRPVTEAAQAGAVR